MLKDIISIRDINKNQIDKILGLAQQFEGKSTNLAQGKILATLFFEPSTRTRLSFESAMCRLGGKVIGFSGTEGTSIKKGETLSDTIRMAEKYSDIIVIRHPLEGSARLASEVSKVPILNGGDGGNQHPTQTCLDLYTIKKIKGRISGLTVSLVGDLKHARTMRSICYALSMYNARIILCSPDELRISRELIDECVDKFGLRFVETNNLKFAVEEADVLYACRIQKERFADPLEALKMEKMFRIKSELLKTNPDLIIMHPLPKVNEIDPAVDSMPNAKYFEQAGYGVPVRMALISLLLGLKKW